MSSLSVAEAAGLGRLRSTTAATTQAKRGRSLPSTSETRDAYGELFRHGGDLHAAALAFPEAPRPWIDLSTGINPVPYPLPRLPDEIWARLPHPSELASLQAVAAARFGCRSENVVVGAGAQALIQLLPWLFPADRVAILKPTYSGHETAWRAAGARIYSAGALPQLRDASRAVIVNPNNPDGRRTSGADLRDLAAHLAARDGLLIVDESFADFEEDTLGRDLPESTIILRSFGKTYGLAGVRLGFAIAHGSIAARLREAVGSWPVSGPAIAIACRALVDRDWLVATRARLAADVEWLDAALQDAGFEILGGTLLFRLARRADAPQVFAKLCEAGVLTRPFADARENLRFGVPKPEDRARVEAALRSAVA